MPKRQEEYEVDAIIGKRRKKNSGSVQYRVLWKGYSKEQATWEPEEHLSNVQYMIEEFNTKIQQKNAQVGNKTTPQNIVSPSVNKQKDDLEPIVEQNSRKQPTSTRGVRKSMRQINSDEDFTQTQDAYQLKSPIVTPQKPKQNTQKIQQEKSIEKKPPVKNGKTNTTVTPSPTQTMNGNSLAKEYDNYKNGIKQFILNQATWFSEDEDDKNQTSLQIQGTFQVDGGKVRFLVHDKVKNTKLVMRRRDIIKKEPISLIRYYQRLVCCQSQ